MDTVTVVALTFIDCDVLLNTPLLVDDGQAGGKIATSVCIAAKKVANSLKSRNASNSINLS